MRSAPLTSTVPSTAWSWPSGHTTASVFVATRTGGPLTLVNAGDPLPAGEQHPAAWDKAGRCWVPGKPRHRRKGA